MSRHYHHGDKDPSPWARIFWNAVGWLDRLMYVVNPPRLIAAGLAALCLTMSWGFWDVDHLLHREAAAANAGAAAERQKIDADVDVHSGRLSAIEAAAADTVVNLNMQGNALLGRLNTTLDIVNRDCGVKVNGKFMPCGTLSDVNQTLGAYRHTATLANIALRHEDQQLTVVDARLGSLFDSGDKAVKKFNDLLDASTDTVNDADDFINRPALAATVDQFATISGNFAASSTDFQTKFHAFLYPPKCLTKWCKVKRIYPYIKGASEMAEPAYWGWQLVKGATP